MRLAAYFLFLFFVCLIACLAPAVAHAQDSTLVVAVHVTRPPVIDGCLSDSAWQRAIPEWRFTQSNPTEFAKPTQRTEVSVLYDDDALYVGARMYDSAPDSIIARLVRRDVDTESDMIAVFLDPYHDHRSGYHFALNAAGTRLDGVRYNDTWQDASWDGVWEGATKRDRLGWTAEFRIPFSQLRFRKGGGIWGVNFQRSIGRNHEEDFLVFTPKNGSGFVSRFWHLTGLNSMSQPRYVELLPYLRESNEYRSREAGNPFVKKSDLQSTLGGDFKIGLGPNLILNGSANPDFGQVEVDPAVVNLSDVETLYDERRPFFIEGSKNFDYGSGGTSDNWSFNWGGADLLYSRRIGRAPQKELPSYDYADIPSATRILGAAKLSGKLGKDWNIGTLHTATRREFGDLTYGGERSRFEVEPAAYYSITRVQKEFEDGRYGLGSALTATHRFFDDPALKTDINSDAFTGGIDGWTPLDANRTFVFSGATTMSHVKGTKERMIALQRSSHHYFQRPDVSHVTVDSSATSLTGYMGRYSVNKEKGNVIFNSAVGFRTPGLELNDIGYLSRADLINAHVGTGYKWTEVRGWSRYTQLIGAVFGSSDFGGNVTNSGIWLQGFQRFLNYWTCTLSVAGNPRSLNAVRTRGGPLTVNEPGWEADLYVDSDNRQTFVLSAGTSGYNTAADNWNRSLWTGLEWKPAGNFSATLCPQLSWNYDPLQWVNNFADSTATQTYGYRYVFAKLQQTELSSAIRANWTFTPTLSLQVYAQPLISSGDYSRFKELSRGRSNDYRTYSAGEVRLENNTYTIDPDGRGPAQEFSFTQPSYSYRSLRGNMILRWEYHPGSTLYFVWTHGRSDYEYQGQFDVNRSLDRLFSANADDIFLIKATYWVSF